MRTLTENERRYCGAITSRFTRLRELLNSAELCDPPDPKKWYGLLAAMKAVQGNAHNDLSFIATLLAKHYLETRFDIQAFDAAAKAQGAVGPDIEAVTQDGRRILGEIKTTVPYRDSDFGATQRREFQRDFAKLVGATADVKILFVTDARTFDILGRRYVTSAPDVEIILLGH